MKRAQGQKASVRERTAADALHGLHANTAADALHGLHANVENCEERAKS
jgi:hypothetical protein